MTSSAQGPQQGPRTTDPDLLTGQDESRTWSPAVVVLVVLAVVVAVVVSLVRSGHQARTTLPGVVGQANSAEQAALGYLTALAEAQPDDALAYLVQQPDSTMFMTKEVMAESVRLSPISDIEVGLTGSPSPDPSGVVRVGVSYTYSGSTYHDDMPVVRCSDGFWRLTGEEGKRTGFKEVRLGSSDVERMLTLNGVAVPPGTEVVQLLPGTYKIGTTHPMLTTSDKLDLGRVTVSDDIYVYHPKLVLTAQARQEVADAVRSSIDSCLSGTVTDGRCGLALYGLASHDGEPLAGEATWSLDPDSADIKDIEMALVLEPREDPARRDEAETVALVKSGRVTGDAGFRVGVHGTMTLDTGEVLHSWGSLSSFSVDISDPDNLVVELSWILSSTCTGRCPEGGGGG